jgi:HK97 family phage prohead protease
MEQFCIPLTVQSMTDATSKKPAVFEGYASVFGTLIDAYVPTRIRAGAFTRTLRENTARIKILWQHNTDEPIGKPLELREDSKGLYLKGQLSATPRGQEASTLLRDGVVDGMSIGLDPVRFEMVVETLDGMPVTVRHISEVRLWEISVVTWPANPSAKVTQVHRRAADDRIDRELTELTAIDAQLHGPSDVDEALRLLQLDLNDLELDLLRGRS